MGQEAMKVLFKEPIKEAVKETLAEEGLTDKVDTERTEATEYEIRETTDERSSRARNVVIPAVAALGVALAVRRLSEGELEPEQVAEKIRGEDTSMEEERSPESGRSQYAEDDAEEVNV